MTRLDRVEFTTQLGAALAAPNPYSALQEVLKTVLVDQVRSWSSDDAPVVRAAAERIDAAGEADARRRAAENANLLLQSDSSNETVLLLLEPVVQRQRFAEVLAKYFDGTISRTQFLSFLSEQRWHRDIRKRAAGLGEDDLRQLLIALRSCDVQLMREKLVMSQL